MSNPGITIPIFLIIKEMLVPNKAANNEAKKEVKSVSPYTDSFDRCSLTAENKMYIATKFIINEIVMSVDVP